MEFINYLSYFNIFAFILFFIITFFLFLQFYLLRKELKLEKKVTKIPDFKEGYSIKPPVESVIIKNKETKFYRKNRIVVLLITLVFFIILGGFLIYDFLNKKTEENKLISIPKIDYIASSGIKVYNEDWIELSDEEISSLIPGKKIFIGLEKANLADIDKARIRVNRKFWLPEDVVENYNENKKVFYKEYIIATDESILRIEGQLHSKIDGWLGD